MNPFAAFPRFSMLTLPLPATVDEGAWAPAVDVYETATDVVVELELPGTAARDVRITWRPEGLGVEGIKGETTSNPLAVGRFLRVERASGPFRRVIPMPAPVAGERGRAAFRNGVLIVTLPKARP